MKGYSVPASVHRSNRRGNSRLGCLLFLVLAGVGSWLLYKRQPGSGQVSGGDGLDTAVPGAPVVDTAVSPVHAPIVDRGTDVPSAAAGQARSLDQVRKELEAAMARKQHPANTADLLDEFGALVGTGNADYRRWRDSLWASVSVSGAPSTAELWVDGVRAGPVSEVPKVRPGSHLLEVRAPGYQSVRWRAVAEFGKTLAHPVQMQVQAKIRIETQPAGMTVWYRGQCLGKAPVEVQADAGVMTFDCEGPGIFPQSVDVAIDPSDASGKAKVLVLKKADALANGDRFSIPDLGLRFACVMPGKFQMGSPDDELGRDMDETLREVELSHMFWIGCYEVTYGQFKAFCDLTGYQVQWGDQGLLRWRDVGVVRFGNMPRSNTWRKNWGDDASLPVTGVTWNDAAAFCKWLTDRETASGRLPKGWVFALPSDAQWEYACRAGGPSGVPAKIDDKAWYQSNSGHRPHAVGTREPNALGVYDMLGNVAEWCLDWYATYPVDGPRDPKGPRLAMTRVHRGGSFQDGGSYMRPAGRSDNSPLFRVNDVGFRAALVPLASLPVQDEPVLVERPKSTARPPEPDKPLRVPSVQLDMCWIPAGTFRMGSPANEPGRDDDERQLTVTLTKSFWMSRTEVTQRQYQSVMGVNPSAFKGDLNRPVEMVSWADAREFCKRLTEQERSANRLAEGYAFALPTEAQWEYACRGGAAKEIDPMSVGGDSTGADGWTKGNSNGRTRPVGTLGGNDFGLYDMLGNVWEWCRDNYGPYPDRDQIDPQGPVVGASRVVRGGAWDSDPRLARPASRYQANEVESVRNVGFRVVLEKTGK